MRSPSPHVSVVSTLLRKPRKLHLLFQRRNVVPVAFFLLLAAMTNIHSIHTTFVLVPTTWVSSPTMQSTSSSSCVGLNSQAWLRGPRYSNIALQEDDIIITRSSPHDNNYHPPGQLQHHHHHQQQQELILQIQDMFQSSHQVQQLLFQTLCAKESRYTTWLLHNDTTTEKTHNELSRESEESIIRLWSVRLTYLALYYHQHRLAIPEAQRRRRRWLSQPLTPTTNSSSSSCQSDLDKYHIGPFDYECPHAKYLIMSPGGNGIGANARAGFVVTLLLGLALDRIVLFPSHVASIRKHTTTSNNVTWPLTPSSYPHHERARPPTTHHNSTTHDNSATAGGDDDENDDDGWILASCPRRDYQCFFRPTTPCTVTLEDIQNAYVLTHEENRKLRRYFEFPQEHLHTKVVQFTSPMFITKHTPWVVRQRLHTYAMTLLKSVPPHDPRLPLMQQGADSILHDDRLYTSTNHNNTTTTKKKKNDLRRTTTTTMNEKKKSTTTTTTYNYRDDYVRLHRALLFYALRPNPPHAHKMDMILSDILPSNFTSASTIGVPIRGSDKCVTESECLTFHQHLQVASQMWSDYVSTHPPHHHYPQPPPPPLLLLQRQGVVRERRNVTTTTSQAALDTSTPTTMVGSGSGSGSTAITATTTTTTTAAGVSPSIIFTTESREIRQSQQDFVSNISHQEQFPYQFQFITNPKDVTPDSGFMKHILVRKQQQQQQQQQHKAHPQKKIKNDEHDASADDIMLSSMTSLKLQLMPRLSIGNCCSNFHVLIQDYLMEGGGAARGGNTFMCLQENPNVALRICCLWSKDCHREKANYVETMANS